MKIEQAKPKFEPVVITLETRDEVIALAASVGKVTCEEVADWCKGRCAKPNELLYLPAFNILYRYLSNVCSK